MAKKKTQSKKPESKRTAVAGSEINLKKDKTKTRGKIFQGTVTRKFPQRVTIQFERMIYVRKYERYTKKRIKVHARLPKNMEDEIQKGDYIMVQECRPLSKIIHFKVIKKIKNKAENFAK
ncbi:MAG TPA: 30S ribosomal protein S17 [Candidatus Nanoarchaeia archaeon]|nr:30S ribosomal protein S17 [Candidatus Nanoarchaeia archaeon]